ncbi:pheromone A receptor-domain-containing protein [Amylostereum chailletii]|nr:pheromone A receptor-domain-containing protein [Amylostereum chailletii]
MVLSPIINIVSRAHAGPASRYSIKTPMKIASLTPFLGLLIASRRSRLCPSQIMDPTYPLVPVVNFIAACLMLFTILTVKVRETLNVGILILCIWLFIACLIQGLEAIVWSKNAENKAPVWCDISSHLGWGILVGIPACSLVITRRLYHIACLRVIDSPGKRERRVQRFLDFFIGVGFPILVVGPFYYVVQNRRFSVIEEVGCSSAIVSSGLTTILVDMWPIILPLISATFYCPRIIWTFYRQRRDVDAFLQSNGSVDRARYLRILAVGCLDILFTLPTGVLFLLVDVAENVRIGDYRLYPGWNYVHHSWTPTSISAAEWRSEVWTSFQLILQQWLSPILSILIFVIFGITVESRAAFRRWFCMAASLLGFKPPVNEDIPNMRFISSQRRVRSPGHSLSMPESSTTNGADFTVSVSSTRPHGEGNLADEEAEIAREEHRRTEDGSVDARTRQAEEVDLTGGYAEKVNVETV